jgi:HD-GYP domain-containing protein (c-di-GMP phosphodiesterase class II)
LVRIMTVADVYDALTSERPYRPAWSPDRALAFLREGTRAQFDLRVVEALAGSVEEGWRPASARLPLEIPGASATVHRFSLFPETNHARDAGPPEPPNALEVRSA